MSNFLLYSEDNIYQIDIQNGDLLKQNTFINGVPIRTGDFLFFSTCLFSGYLISHIKTFEDRLSKLRENDVELVENNESEDMHYSQYTVSDDFRVFKALYVLKPFFWPSTGKNRREIFMNRCRSLCTWLCVILSKACSLSSPIYLGKAVQSLTSLLQKETNSQQPFIQNVIIYSILVLFASTFKESQNLIYVKLNRIAYVEVAQKTFSHLHSLSLDFHLRKKMGNVIRSFTRGLSSAQNMMNYCFLYFIPTILESFIVFLIFLFKFSNIRLAGICIASISLYIYVTVMITQWRRQFRAASVEHDNKLHDRLSDSLINYETIKYFGTEDYELNQFSKCVSAYQLNSQKTQISLSVLNITQQVIISSTVISSLLTMGFFSIYSSDSSDIGWEIGLFVSVNVYLIRVFEPLNFLGSIYNLIVTSMVDMFNLGQLLAESSDIIDSMPTPHHIPTPQTYHISPSIKEHIGIEFDHVEFHYRNQPKSKSLKNISFNIPAQSSLAIVGHTGAGKTSIIRLLYRFYDVCNSYIYLTCGDNHRIDIRSIPQRLLRSLISIVPQDVVLFNDTIRLNLAYGDRNILSELSEIDTSSENPFESIDQKLYEILKKCNLYDFVMSLPDGLSTIVGERGLKLSGGEKQRLAIGRCLLKNTPIVVLDEATSALDFTTEKSVNEALQILREEGGRKTILSISHRLSTITHCDQIIVLKNGEIIERGDHDSLSSKDGEYAQFLKDSK